MAIAKNVAKRVYGTANLTVTITSLDCTGSDRILLVYVVTATSTVAPTSVVFNGSENLTKIGEYATTASPEGTAFKVTLWALVAPTSTTANVVVTFASNTGNVGAMGQCFTGVDQTTPYGSVETVQVTADASGAQPSLTLNSTTTTDLCVVGIGLGRLTGNTARTPGTGVTEEIGHGANTYAGHAIWTKAGATTSTVVDGTLTTATSHRMVGVALKEVAAGGTTYDQSVTGSLGLSGTVALEASIDGLTGSLGLNGSFANQANKQVAGSLGLAGAFTNLFVPGGGAYTYDKIQTINMSGTFQALKFGGGSSIFWARLLSIFRRIVRR